MLLIACKRLLEIVCGPRPCCYCSCWRQTSGCSCLLRNLWGACTVCRGYPMLVRHMVQSPAEPSPTWTYTAEGGSFRRARRKSWGRTSDRPREKGGPSNAEPHSVFHSRDHLTFEWGRYLCPDNPPQVSRCKSAPCLWVWIRSNFWTRRIEEGASRSEGRSCIILGSDF